MEHEYMRTHYGEKYWDKLCGKPMPEESTPPIWKENYLLQQQYIEELEHELNVANQRIDMLTACNADVARIAKERDDTLKRIKMLEGHIEHLESVGDSLFNGVTRIEAEQRWNKAKEAKP